MTEASSIGKIGEPFVDTSNNRVKWFSLDPVKHKRTLDAIVFNFDSLFTKHGVSRVTARFFVANNLLDDITRYNEAFIPLDGDFNGFSLVYLGKNSQDRYEPEELVLREIARAREIEKGTTILPYNEAIARVREAGFRINTQEEFSEEELSNIADLYNNAFKGSYLFELNSANVRTLVCSPSNIKVVVKNDDRIVSIGVAELTTVEVVGKEFKFSELSDAATYPEYGKIGLYTGTCAMLMKELAVRNVNLVYGEARAAHHGVNVACRRSGRKYHGLLNKHCKISGEKDIPEIGPYENLNVWAIGGQSLRRICSD